MTKKLITMLLTAAMLLAAVGCTPSEPAENSSTSTPSVTQEEIDALKAENERLQLELDALKGESSNEEQDAEGGEPKEEVETEGSTASEPASKPTTPPANTQAPTANNNSSSAAASKPNNQATAKPTGNNSQPAASTPAPQKTSSGKGPLAKYSVTVTDKTTPATSTIGEFRNGQPFYIFYSADEQELGQLPNAAVKAAIYDNNLTQLEADEQFAWFTEQFNIYRGLDGDTEYIPVNPSDSDDDFDIEEFREEVIRLTNKEREKAGLDPLTADDTAMEYAQIRAEELVTSYSHTRPNNQAKSMDGLEFIENIAYGQKTPKEVVQDWMNSSGHKATLMSDYSDYGNRIGVGCYKKNGTIYWTQEFVLWDSEG